MAERRKLRRGERELTKEGWVARFAESLEKGFRPLHVHLSYKDFDTRGTRMG